jgi:hypothetical protein
MRNLFLLITVLLSSFSSFATDKAPAEISFSEAGLATFKGMVQFGGKAWAVWMLATPGAPVLVVGLGASFLAGRGFDKVLEYCNREAETPCHSTATAEDIMDGFECLGGSDGEEHYQMPGWVESTTNRAGKLCREIVGQVSHSVEQLPGTISNCVSNTIANLPETLTAVTSGGLLALVSNLLVGSDLLAAGCSALGNNLGTQGFRILQSDGHQEIETQDCFDEPTVCLGPEFWSMKIIDNYTAL